MRLLNRITEKTEHYIRSYVIGKLLQRRTAYRLLYRNDMEVLKRTLRPGDIILIDGDYWVSDWIKVFSYHTWTHCAMWVGDSPALPPGVNKEFVQPGGNIVEAMMKEGVIVTSLEKYRDFNLRICRPMGMARNDLRRVIQFVLEHVGSGYDEDNVTQFVHFTFANDYDPTRSMGNVEQSRYTCSSLLASAFESVGFPVLHFFDKVSESHVAYHATHIQPKDFDLSPNFQVIKTPVRPPQARSGAFRRLASAFSDRFVG
jgi:hypothetical protein